MRQAAPARTRRWRPARHQTGPVRQRNHWRSPQASADEMNCVMSVAGSWVSGDLTLHRLILIDILGSAGAVESDHLWSKYPTGASFPDGAAVLQGLGLRRIGLRRRGRRRATRA